METFVPPVLHPLDQFRQEKATRYSFPQTSHRMRAKPLNSSFENTYDVDLFASAEAALEALSERPPDLVLLDLGLPGMSGIEALKIIKKRRPETLVVVITAYEDADRIISAMKSGAYDYIIKPLELQTLEVTVQNALETVRPGKRSRDCRSNSSSR
ncbi:MAG TPA: response regulator [Candidatus Methanoperedens sp.]|nr:response regulator [Candidatus Methanoperedens sp.]